MRNFFAIYGNSMHHTYMKYLVLTAFVLFFASPSQAEYFVWKDADTGVLLSYPDTWRQALDYAADERLVIEAPGTDQARCSVKAREDRRFLVYPQRYRAAIQEQAYSEDFWNDYLASYDNVVIHNMQDGTGLGQAFASMVTASYITAHPLKNQHKTSIASAGLYGDTAFIYECSALAQAFPQYQVIFQSIMKSISFPKAYHELPQGNNLEMQRGAIIQTRDPSDRYTGQY